MTFHGKKNKRNLTWKQLEDFLDKLHEMLPELLYETRVKPQIKIKDLNFLKVSLEFKKFPSSTWGGMIRIEQYDRIKTNNQRQSMIDCFHLN